MLSSTLLLSSLAGLAWAHPHVSPLNLFKRLTSGCPADGPVSCSGRSGGGSCCFEDPGGLIAQPQFWDTKPSTGPSDSFTIHGLWPDRCNGGFDSSCDPSRAYKDIPGLLNENGASSTLAFMEKFWVDIKGQNEQFWEHEWVKHGTCMSTLEPSCLPSGSPRGAEAAAYFQTTERVFKSFPTFQILKSAGITPSTTQTFTRAQLEKALRDGSGAGVTPGIDCSSGRLNGVTWYFNLKGSVIDGTFVPIDAPTRGSCPSSNIKYPPK